MSERRGAVHGRVADVVHGRAAGRVESQDVAHTLGDLVVARRRVATDPQATDDLPVLVERYPAAEEDQPTVPLSIISLVRLSQAVERVSRLRKCVQLSGRKGE